MGTNATGDNPLGQFLRARRELVRPSDIGVASYGRRRVPGLRREELALLAGVSVDYYVRLEQGRDGHPSEQVLDALARALQLDEAAAAHLRQLARPAPRRRRRVLRAERVPPELAQLLDLWSNTPAFVLGRRTDVLAGNRLAAALHAGFTPGQNLVRVVFGDPDSRRTFPEWEKVAGDCVASLRAAAVEDLHDPLLAEVVGELSVVSESFRRLWARHDVRERASGTKRFDHPLVGPLDLRYDSFAVHAARGQVLVVYHAEPGSSGAQRLALLSSLVAGERGPSAEALAHSAQPVEEHGI